MHAHRAPQPRRNTPGRLRLFIAGILSALLGAGLALGVNSNVSNLNGGGQNAADGQYGSNPTPVPPTQAPPPEPEPEPKPEPADITIAAAGDILTHMPVLRSARVNGGYDLNALWHRLDPWVQGADLALCHLEVPIAPAGTAPSGYPKFGAHSTLAEDVAKQGWNGCSTASNHSVDRGFAGIETTLDALEDVGLGAMGTARTLEEARQVQIYELERAERTVQIAHLSATYGLNGLPKPEGKPWAVEVFDAEVPDVSELIEQAKTARDDGADLVVASIHCCIEYQTAPTAAQRVLMQEIADSAAIDLVIGHHAHVPQPITMLEGGPDGAGMWVAYGLGNYVSNQSAQCCVPETSNGVLMFATAHVPATGPVRVTGIEWTALTVDRLGGHQIYPLRAEAQGVGQLTAAQMQDRYERVRSAVDLDAAELLTPPQTSGPRAEVIPRFKS